MERSYALNGARFALVARESHSTVGQLKRAPRRWNMSERRRCDRGGPFCAKRRFPEPSHEPPQKYGFSGEGFSQIRGVEIFLKLRHLSTVDGEHHHPIRFESPPCRATGPGVVP